MMLYCVENQNHLFFKDNQLTLFVETTVLLFEPYILMTYKIVFVYLNNCSYYSKLKITKI